MSALNRTPTNMNFLQADGFQIVVKKCPHVTFFTQEVTIPGFVLPITIQPNPYVRLPHTGDHVEFNDLELSFKVDEDLKNYIEIYNWIMGMGYPDDHAQYKDLSRKDRTSGEGLYSDISVIVTTNIKNYNVEFLFRDALPISLSGFKLTTTDTDVPKVSTSVTFSYTKYDIQTLPK